MAACKPGQAVRIVNRDGRDPAYAGREGTYEGMTKTGYARVRLASDYVALIARDNLEPV